MGDSRECLDSVGNRRSDLENKRYELDFDKKQDRLQIDWGVSSERFLTNSPFFIALSPAYRGEKRSYREPSSNLGFRRNKSRRRSL